MSDSTIAVTEGAGKNLDTEQLTVAATTVQRERVQVAGAADVAIAAVKNADPTTEYGLITRNIPSGTQPVKSGTVTAVTATWDNTTADQTTLVLDTTGIGTVLFTLRKTGTISAGWLYFEVSDDAGTNWSSISMARVATPDFEANFNPSFGFTILAWQGNVAGQTRFRVQLTPALGGAGSLDLRMQGFAMPVGFSNVNSVTQGLDSHDAPLSSKPVPIGGRAYTGTPADVANFDAVYAWFLTNGALATVLTFAGVQIPGDAANGLDVDVRRMAALVAGAATIGAVTGPTADNAANPVLKLSTLPAVALAAAPTRTEGNVNPLRVTLAGDAVVTLDGEAVVLGAGTAEIGKLAAGVANIGDVDVVTMPVDAAAAEVQGTVADAAADAQNPVGIGLTARQTNRTAVADGNRVRAIADDMGRQVVVLGQVRDLVSHQHTQIASSSAETTIVTAVASEFHDLVMLVLTNQTATAVNVTIKDATAGTTRMIVALAANGGAVLPFPVPLPQLAAVNNNWTATLSSAAVTVNVFAQFIKNV